MYLATGHPLSASYCRTGSTAQCCAGANRPELTGARPNRRPRRAADNRASDRPGHTAGCRRIRCLAAGECKARCRNEDHSGITRHFFLLSLVSNFAWSWNFDQATTSPKPPINLPADRIAYNSDNWMLVPCVVRGVRVPRDHQLYPAAGMIFAHCPLLEISEPQKERTMVVLRYNPPCSFSVKSSVLRREMIFSDRSGWSW